jgi:hypothetical protein
MMAEVTYKYCQTKTAGSALPDVLVDYLNLLLEDVTTSPTVLAETRLNSDFDAMFDLAADCRQLLHAQVDPRHEFVAVTPASWTQTFSCLRVKLGPYSLLVPFDRIRRVERVETFNRFAGVSLPGLEADSHLLITDADLPGIYVDGVEGFVSIEPDDVRWRRPGKHNPWFVGTHRSLLSYIFDPIYFLQQTRIGWRK